uniref:Small ribosomal subunit protein uS9c n=1 Tax=Derbesia sp. WEST4838 TaxID=1847751 RepID=A0A1C9JBB8_9CHLO|nr:ribosomal protein S9 [Derbesia sp. WEST4838]AOP19146.1 ribosomal protein S9 [Derbesia sp. WEST4838]
MNTSIGRRKCSIAITQFSRNKSDQIIINGLNYRQYFQQNPFQIATILKPFEVLGLSEKLSISITVKGGGLTGQSEACCLAIARLLQKQKPVYRQLLKTKSLLRQDARQKERRKYGLKKARKAPQYSKR